MAVCPSSFVSCLPSARFQIMIEVSSLPDASRSPSSVVRHWTEPVCPSSVASCAPSAGFQRMIELSSPRRQPAVGEHGEAQDRAGVPLERG